MLACDPGGVVAEAIGPHPDFDDGTNQGEPPAKTPGSESIAMPLRVESQCHGFEPPQHDQWPSYAARGGVHLTVPEAMAVYFHIMGDAFDVEALNSALTKLSSADGVDRG